MSKASLWQATAQGRAVVLWEREFQGLLLPGEFTRNTSDSYLSRRLKASIDTGSPEHFVEYGSKHGYTPNMKKQCLINSTTAHQRWEEVRLEPSEYNTYLVMK
jgi:hypothetical protein